MRRDLLRRVVLVFAVVGASTVAVAQGSEEVLRIEYVAPSICPREDAFVASVHARTTRFRLAAGEVQSRSFSVSIATGDGEVRGRIVIRGGDAKESSRVVVGDTCDEVVAALALIAALAIDPASATRPVQEATAVAASSSPTPSVPLGATGPERDVPAPTAASSPPARAWHLAAVAGAAAVAGVSPRMVLGLSAGVEAAGPRRGLFAPTLRVAFARASSGNIDVDGPTAHFTWTVGTVEACPARWSHATLDLEPCARVQGGVLEGSGANIVPARDDAQPWLALGAVGRAQWFFLRPLFLEAETGVHVPLVRPRYFFEPDVTVYRPPVVGWFGGGALGARFL